TPSCPGACPPGSLRLVLRLTAPGGAPTRPRSCRLVGATALGSGHAPVAPTLPVGEEADYLRSAYPHRALLLPVPPPLPGQRPARPHACAPVSRSCSLSHSVHQSHLTLTPARYMQELTLDMMPILPVTAHTKSHTPGARLEHPGRRGENQSHHLRSDTRTPRDVS